MNTPDTNSPKEGNEGKPEHLHQDGKPSVWLTKRLHLLRAVRSFFSKRKRQDTSAIKIARFGVLIAAVSTLASFLQWNAMRQQVEDARLASSESAAVAKKQIDLASEQIKAARSQADSLNSLASRLNQEHQQWLWCESVRFTQADQDRFDVTAVTTDPSAYAFDLRKPFRLQLRLRNGGDVRAFNARITQVQIDFSSEAPQHKEFYPPPVTLDPGEATTVSLDTADTLRRLIGKSNPQPSPHFSKRFWLFLRVHLMSVDYDQVTVSAYQTYVCSLAYKDDHVVMSEFDRASHDEPARRWD